MCYEKDLVSLALLLVIFILVFYLDSRLGRGTARSLYNNGTYAVNSRAQNKTFN